MASVKKPKPAAGKTSPQLPLTDNLANIGLIKRMWRAQWPEFSWLTKPGEESSRCFQMFAPDISRVGYGAPDVNHGNQCPVWAIMCPQQGTWIPDLNAALNIEVTVTGVNGWVTETSKLSLDAQMTIKPKIWFSPDTMAKNQLIGDAAALFQKLGIPFPSTKDTAIELEAYGVNQQGQPEKSNLLTIRNGLDPAYAAPPFAQHSAYDIYQQLAATTVYVAVEVGQVISKGAGWRNQLADLFNNLVMEVLNLAAGNLLAAGNILSWNIWALSPEDVLTPEWQLHAEYWRFSLDVNHRSPEGAGRDPQYSDGRPFAPPISAVVAAITQLRSFLNGIDLLVAQGHTEIAAADLTALVAAGAGAAAASAPIQTGDDSAVANNPALAADSDSAPYRNEDRKATFL